MPVSLAQQNPDVAEGRGQAAWAVFGLHPTNVEVVQAVHSNAVTTFVNEPKRFASPILECGGAMADDGTVANQTAQNDLAALMSRGWIRALGFYHTAFGLLILYLLFKIWPTSIGGDTEEDLRTVELLWGVFRFRMELFPER